MSAGSSLILRCLRCVGSGHSLVSMELLRQNAVLLLVGATSLPVLYGEEAWEVHFHISVTCSVQHPCVVADCLLLLLPGGQCYATCSGMIPMLGAGVAQVQVRPPGAEGIEAETAHPDETSTAPYLASGSVPADCRNWVSYREATVSWASDLSCVDLLE